MGSMLRSANAERLTVSRGAIVLLPSCFDGFACCRCLLASEAFGEDGKQPRVKAADGNILLISNILLPNPNLILQNISIVMSL